MAERGPTLELSLELNGQPMTARVAATSTLAELIRGYAGLTGTKIACGEGTCGACTVLVDGAPTLSCILLAAQAEGSDVRTVESMASSGTLSALQQAFIAEDAFQCGFCTPGQLASATALLAENADPTAAEVRHAMAGNLCRCGAYVKIERAILRVAAEARSDG
jgi:aerobic-type carbon monoxide dehydrogenase small subunit (CoxS/CutS family)